MKIRIPAFLTIVLILTATGCYQFTGGYRGHKFTSVSTKNVYYDIPLNTIYLVDTPIKKLWIYITRETDSLNENSVIFDKTIRDDPGIMTRYAFPDSLFTPYKSKKITIELNADDKIEKMYSIIIEPKSWEKGQRIYGFVRVYETP